MSIKESYDCAVIGAGPSGMMAAGQAAQCGAKVIVFERNKMLGRKLGITGKGRCNVTNNSPVNEIMENINGRNKFMYSALNGFSPRDTIVFFEGLGVRLKTERGGRVFPESDRAADIVNAMRSFLNGSGASICHKRVIDIEAKDSKIEAVLTDEGTVNVKSVVIACGGLSYPATGSTGDGYGFAQRLGHRIIPPRASLVALTSEDAICGECEGLTLKNVTLKLLENETEVFTDFGELVFTRTGISGPIALSASAHLKHAGQRAYCTVIDLKPALSEEILEKRILRDFEELKNKQFKNALDKLLPSSLRLPIVKKSGIPPDIQVNRVTKEQRRSLAALLKNLRLEGIHPGPIEEAIITAGGVDTAQLDPKTMGSKLVRGLFFAGEVMDLDAYTGGFNLQIAFSTGYAAGNGAAGFCFKYFGGGH